MEYLLIYDTAGYQLSQLCCNVSNKWTCILRGNRGYHGNVIVFALDLYFALVQKHVKYT